MFFLCCFNVSSGDSFFLFFFGLKKRAVLRKVLNAMFDKSVLRNGNNMGLKVKQHPRKLLYYARVDNRNPQTVGHMCEGESRGEGLRLSELEKESPLNALPIVQHKEFINFHLILACD